MDPQVERAATRVGKLLKGKWRLDRLLGVGGMAAVYGATHRNGKRVAVKMLHPEISFDADVRQRFLREGYVANAVEHPGALTVDDDDIDEDGSAFLVMELLQGETLDARMEQNGGLLPVEGVLPLIDQVLSVLSAAHSRGIVHRDLKPENLFLTRDGAVKVLDFGIARLRELSGPTTTTQTGAMMGTPAFMSPEQARGRWAEVDAQSDLWAIGATLFTLLTGQHVHEAETVNEALAMAVMVPARSLATAAPDVPPSVVELVDRALQQDKSRRWKDASSMQEALREAYRAITGGEELHSRRQPVVSAVLEVHDAGDAGDAMPHVVAFPLAPSVVTGPGVSATLNRSAGAAVPAARAAFATRSGLVAAALALGLAIVVVTFLRQGSNEATGMAGSDPRPTAAAAESPTPRARPSEPSRPELPAAPPSANPAATPPARTRKEESHAPDAVAPPPRTAPVAASTERAARPSAARKPVAKPRSPASGKPTADPFSGRF